tara:strand:- start:369 stop:773 length:405 start_codon:yes stop_codon:yes gene_type:complete
MITLYDYLAYNVPNECQDLLMRYDIPTAQNEDELTENLKQFVRVYKEDALEQLSEIHPDKDLIMDMANMATPFEGKQNDVNEFLNASGTIDRISTLEHNMMSGSNNQPTNILDKMDVMLGIGIALLTATLFKKD